MYKKSEIIETPRPRPHLKGFGRTAPEGPPKMSHDKKVLLQLIIIIMILVQNCSIVFK